MSSPPPEYLQCPTRNTVSNKRRRKLRWRWSTEAEFLEDFQTKVLSVFLRAIHSQCYCFALRFLFLQIHATSYTVSRVQLVYTVKEKGGKQYPLPCCLRNSYRNLKSENSQYYVQKPQRNCTFKNSAQVAVLVRPPNECIKYKQHSSST